MSNILFILAGIAALGVVASLGAGIVIMAKGGETAKNYSNKLMRARVLLQGLTIVLFALAVMSR